MGNKINIAELLKDCPKGMELDCTICNNVVTLEAVDTEEYFPIRVVSKAGFHHALTREGCVYEEVDAKCVIFPKGKTTWEGFVPPYQFKDGDIVTSVFQGVVQGTGIFDYEEQSEAWIHVCINHNNEFSTDGYLGYVYDLRIATEEEKAKLFDVIMANGYKWNEETKTLEKLIQPKFKVGDRVCNKNYKDYIYDIYDIIDKGYRAKEINADCPILILFGSQEDNYELVPNKFDITTLKAFDKVLVRDVDRQIWIADFFSHNIKEPFGGYAFACIGHCWHQCIPYEHNEHLLGTTNDCDEFFKTWK